MIYSHEWDLLESIVNYKDGKRNKSCVLSVDLVEKLLNEIESYKLQVQDLTDQVEELEEENDNLKCEISAALDDYVFRY